MKYLNLLIMTLLSSISMYVLMYMMVNSYDNVYANLNQFYMAIVMTIPMLFIELLVMRKMYSNPTFNIVIFSFSVIIFLLLIMFIRKQTAISDKEFLKSMIPHHAAAVLMCEKASLDDPEIKKLCENIVKTQQSEIAYMKTKLEALK